MRYAKSGFVAAVCALILIPLVGAPIRAGDPVKTKVNGTLSEIDGIRVLRVWGTPEERGFAHGYLLGQDFIRLIDGFLTTGNVVNAAQYENELLPRLRLFRIQPAYEAELRGMLAGIEARAGGTPEIPVLKRPLRFEDLLATNTMGDMSRMMCSSFAAWGPLTENGHTITGRNMDWPRNPALEGSLVVIVHVPAPGSEALGWVSVFWPGLIGCTTGMNAEGVSVAMHDSNSPAPSTAGDFTPSTLLYREAVESAHARTAFEDIARVFGRRYTVAGYNMMVTGPAADDAPAAGVFESDGDLTRDGGMTLRKPEGSNPFLVCTNHSRQRYAPTPCVRYPRLIGVLEKIAAGSDGGRLTLERAWRMLQGASTDDTLTHHSVVFEPNKHLMHVAFAQNGRHAPQCKKVTLDVAKLLAGDYPGGK